jgi:outer membrane protein assembly factor BamB
MNRRLSCLVLVPVVFTTLAFAQMGGGMGIGSGMGMNGAMGSREMMDGPTVGPDGTAYVVHLASRSVSNPRMMSPSTNTSKYELVAISVRDGSVKWKLEIMGTMLSEPTLAKDGKIFLTASDFVMNGLNRAGRGMMNPASSATSGRSRLIIVPTDVVPARISKTVGVDSDVLSAPRIATDETGNYVVYVTGFEMGADLQDAIASGQKTLYAFTPDGSIKFTVKINQP